MFWISKITTLNSMNRDFHRILRNLLKISLNSRQRTSTDWEILGSHCKHLSHYLIRTHSFSPSIVVPCHLQSRDMLRQWQEQATVSSRERDLGYAHLMLWTQQWHCLFILSFEEWNERRNRRKKSISKNITSFYLRGDFVSWIHNGNFFTV